MAGSFCTICRARIPRGSRCPRHAIKSPSNRSWHAPGATRMRLRVLRRDDYTCTRCGSTRDLEVHHIAAAADGGATTMVNLVTVCGDCHRALEAERESERGPEARASAA